jgi:hypothetical protein
MSESVGRVPEPLPVPSSRDLPPTTGTSVSSSLCTVAQNKNKNKTNSVYTVGLYALCWTYSKCRRTGISSHCSVVLQIKKPLGKRTCLYCDRCSPTLLTSLLVFMYRPIQIQRGGNFGGRKNCYELQNMVITFLSFC